MEGARMECLKPAWELAVLRGELGLKGLVLAGLALSSQQLPRKRRQLFKDPLFVCLSFRATPAAYGGSQAGGQIGAVTPGLRQSHVCNLHHISRQHRILNPLSKARD